MLPSTQTYKEWTALIPLELRARNVMRDLAIRLLSLRCQIDVSKNWIRFPYYHHVFDDERSGFEKQLDYFLNFGDFISLDDASLLLENNDSIDGNYFCITFDDGLKNCLSGAVPILSEKNISATFYIVTDLVGESLRPDDSISRNVFGFKGSNSTLDFLTWEDCRKMQSAGMTIGSHTRSHARLLDLDEANAAAEIKDSKTVLESMLNVECSHFCAPYGLPGIDFNLERDHKLVQSAGYKSFVTGTRGATFKGDSPLSIKRDHFLANWGLHQVKYFLSI